MKTQKGMQNDALEWLGILIGPVAWLTQFLLKYVVVRWECIHQSKLAVNVIPIVFLVLVLGGGAISLFYARKTGKSFAESEKISARPHFMAMVGVFSSALFAVGIVMQAIPSFILNPCDR
jgi:uncharacterized oligopeptide transporter (OPT) family protein